MKYIFILSLGYLSSLVFYNTIHFPRISEFHFDVHYPFICSWAHRLIPFSSSCHLSGSEHECATSLWWDVELRLRSGGSK